LRCFRLVLPLGRPLFRPCSYHSAAFDVLANFLRLSTFQPHVNLFFAFLEIFSSQSALQVTFAQHKMSKHPDGKKSAAEPKLLIFCCSGLGLDSAGLRLKTAIKRLDCAPTSCLRPHYCRGPGAKLITAYSEYRAFHFRASSTLICDFLRVSTTQPQRNPAAVNNLHFL
jgi:hypothetical protein